MENAKTVESIKNEIAKLNGEISQAESELRALEAAGDTSVKGLDAHGRLVSRITMLNSHKTALEAEILPAKKAEAAAKVAGLKAEYDAAFAERAEVMKKCEDVIKGWFDYPGGAPHLRNAIANAKPVREINVRAMALQGQLAGAQTALKNLS